MTTEVAGEFWHEVLCLDILLKPEQRGSKHARVMKRWKGDGSICFGGDKVRVDASSHPPRVWGEPVVLMTDDNRDSTRYMSFVRKEAKLAWDGRPLLDCPIGISAEFLFERPASHLGTGRNAGTLKASAPAFHAQSPDLAKLLRAIEDALTGAVWVDDRFVCRYFEPTGRKWTTSGARTTVRIFVPDDYEPQEELF